MKQKINVNNLFLLRENNYDKMAYGNFSNVVWTK